MGGKNIFSIFIILLGVYPSVQSVEPKIK